MTGGARGWMLFNSYEFILVFLPVAVLGHFAAGRLGGAAACGWTAAASLVFYGWWNPPYVALIAGSILVNYGLARAIRAGGRAVADGCLVAGVLANLALLIYYKYAAFLAAILAGGGEADAPS